MKHVKMMVLLCVISVFLVMPKTAFAANVISPYILDSALYESFYDDDVFLGDASLINDYVIWMINKLSNPNISIACVNTTGVCIRNQYREGITIIYGAYISYYFIEQGRFSIVSLPTTRRNIRECLTKLIRQ